MASNVEVKAVVTAEDKASATLQKFSNSIDKTATSASSAASGASLSFRNFASNASTAFGSVADNIQSVVTKMALLATASSFGAGKFISLASDLQNTQQSMDALVGSTAEANKIFGELYNYTLGKPIAFPTAAAAAKTLAGYGISADKVVDSMKDLSTISIVTGGDLSSLALAYGQVNARGKLMGQETIQLVNQSVPVIKILAAHFHKNLTDMAADMEGGKVSAQDFNAAIHEYVSTIDISKFSNTFKNRLISLQGSIRSFGLALVGVHIDPQLGLVVEPGGVFDRLSNYLPKLADGLKKLKPAFVAGIGWMLDHGDDLKAIIVGVGAAFVAAKVAAMGFAIAAAANPATLIAAGITALIGALVALQVKFDWVGKTVDAVSPFFQRVGDILTKYVTPGFQALGDIFTTQLVPAIGQLVDAYKNLYNALEPALTAALKLWVKLLGAETVIALRVAAAAITLFVQEVAWLVSWIGNTINWLADLIRWIGNIPGGVAKAVDAIKTQFKNLQDAIGTAIGNIKDFFTSVPDTVGSFANTVKNKLSGFADDVKDKLTSGFRAVSNFLQPWRDDFVGKLTETLNSAKNALIDYDKDTLKRWKDNFSNTTTAIKNWGTQTYSNIKDALADGLKAVKDWGADTYQSMKTSLANGALAIKDWGVDTYNNVKDALTNAIRAIKDWGVDTYSNTKTSLGNAIQAIKDWGSDLYTNTKTSLGNFLTAIGEFFTSLPGKIKDLLHNTGSQIADNHVEGIKSVFGDQNKMAQIGEAILGGFALVIASIAIGLLDIGTKIINWVVTGIINMSISMFNAGVNAISGFVNGMASAVQQIPNFVSGIVNWVKNAIGDTYHWLMEAGKWVIYGLKDGMMSVINQIKDVGGNIANAVKDKVKSLLGIHSPSTVFAGYGANIVQGLVNGINGGIGKVQDAASNLTGVVQDPTLQLSTSSAPSGSTMNGSSSGYATQVTQVPPQMNITIQAGAFLGTQMEARKYATLIMQAYDDVQSAGNTA